MPAARGTGRGNAPSERTMVQTRAYSSRWRMALHVSGLPQYQRGSIAGLGFSGGTLSVCGGCGELGCGGALVAAGGGGVVARFFSLVRGGGFVAGRLGPWGRGGARRGGAGFGGLAGRAGGFG